MSDIVLRRPFRRLAFLAPLSIGVQVLNALLLPIVLGFLYLLARQALPDPYRLKGGYAVAVGAIILVTAGFGVVAGLLSLVS